MRRFVVSVTASVALLLGVRADAETMTATADTYVTTNGVLGGHVSIHGTENTLGVIGALCAQATPLIQFDLSSLSGRQVTGDATLTLRLVGSWNNAACTQRINVYEEHSGWNETTTSWNNLPGPGWWDEPPATYGTMGPLLDSQTVSTTNGQPQNCSWTIPGSVVQSWIDSPATNHGLVLISLTTPACKDLWFSSREGGVAPQLTFSTVPEPSSLTLIGAAVLGLLANVWCRRRAA